MPTTTVFSPTEGSTLFTQLHAGSNRVSTRGSQVGVLSQHRKSTLSNRTIECGGSCFSVISHSITGTSRNLIFPLTLTKKKKIECARFKATGHMSAHHITPPSLIFSTTMASVHIQRRIKYSLPEVTISASVALPVLVPTAI
ncbi:hypothetical protein, unlikely [Trypanosoma brucei gambiense DAL972]|uniref:Uncharacterized protein n=1 Tax=Trypanosoma brucei gambiense (strain MHOM/CI/86/DAL972) TaxID=679716 RepID=C9ZU48_TRYB9|nr:hypothetical protein, unlikely [Trypanosoma brucei gambiense DAL972]CBH12934.1 hypothetical protein, unlikely [Trypanosoma brucei gambiense DAL972]|eukprot:XP_011775213.1 hypothetical protein, unlikely [Trypanosoma brucei gambiense DAL972]